MTAVGPLSDRFWTKHLVAIRYATCTAQRAGNIALLCKMYFFHVYRARRSAVKRRPPAMRSVFVSSAAKHVGTLAARIFKFPHKGIDPIITKRTILSFDRSKSGSTSLSSARGIE